MVDYSANRISFETYNGFAPLKGSKAIRIDCFLALKNPFAFDLTSEQMDTTLEWVQGMFVDNSGNANSITLTFGLLNQPIVIPAYSQGYLPVLCPNDPRISVSCTNAEYTPVIWLLNFPVPVGVWRTRNATISGAVTVTSNPTTDGSGSITLGATAQPIFASVIPTNGFGIYNPDPVEDLWVSDGGTAAPNAQGSIRIQANGGWYETPPNSAPIGIISLYGATTAHKFTARRW